MTPIEKLKDYFKEFPGIGERQALRFVYFLLHKNPSYINEFIKRINELKEEIKQCPNCYLFFQDKKNSLCENCNSNKTDKTTLMVVEKDNDYDVIHKSKMYNGRYFIIGGLVPIITKNTPKYIRINELVSRVTEYAKKDNLKEIILALSVSPQGNHTDLYIREILNSIVLKHDINIVSLGKGLSTGLELEYSDRETIKNAIKNRS